MPDVLAAMYLTLLAAAISRRLGAPVATEGPRPEDLFRQPLFQDFFGDLLPGQYNGTAAASETCIDLLLRGGTKAQPQGEQVPLHRVLSPLQAAYVRSGTESLRQGFSTVIDRLVDEARLLEPKNLEEFLRLKTTEVAETAQMFGEGVTREVLRVQEQDQQQAAGVWKAAISFTLPVAGMVLDQFIFDRVPGPATLMGSLGAYLNFMLTRQGPRRDQEQEGHPLPATPRERGYLYLNRLWEIQGRGAIQTQRKAD